MAKPTSSRSSSPPSSLNASGPRDGGQYNTSTPAPAPTSPQSSQPNDRTESIVEGDWVAINPSAALGNGSPGGLPATTNEPDDAIPLSGGIDQGTVDPEDEGEQEGYESGEDDRGVDVEENVIGKLAALLAEKGDSVQGEEDMKELVERELRAYGVDLGMGSEYDGEEDGKEMVERRGE